MTFGTPRKFDFARQIAAAVGYVALCGFDRVSVLVFPDNPEEAAARSALRAIRGRRSSLEFFQNLSRVTAQGAVPLNQVLRRGALEARHAGVAVVLSDFLDPAGYEEGLSALVARLQVSAVQILAEEISPRLSETCAWWIRNQAGRKRLLAGIGSTYQKTVQSFCQRLREFCRNVV
jgi:hypothetical protein